MFHEKGPSFVELVKQALSSTRDGYELLAPKFDYTPFCTPEGLLEQVVARLRQGPAVHSAIDLCCGTGEALRHLMPLVSRTLVGVDFSPLMLAQAETKLARSERGAPDLRLIASDVFWIPIREEFDLVTCFGAFGHIEEHREARFIEIVHRLLRPGGRFVFVTTEMPAVLSRPYLLSRGFNATMRLRNAILHPPFIMYYLTFLLPGIATKLERAGFDVEVEREVFAPPYRSACLVTATRR